MLLQSTISPPPPLQNLCVSSSSFFYSLTLIKNGFSFPTLVRTDRNQTNPLSVTCSSISDVHNYGTVDHEQKPALKWSSLYRRISLMEDPSLGSSSILNQWEEEGRKLTKWELCRVVKELRKYRRFPLALGVYEWMHNQGDRFRLSSSDTAIELDLISKVHGVPSAEEYFLRLSDPLKDNRTYGSLLNAYVRAKMREKAESLIVEMREKGYANHSLPFNVMMTLYMKLKEYEKVIEMISEMLEKDIKLDIYSYNIWVTTTGAMGSSEQMEEVLQRMKLDTSIYPNWTTYSTMATMYMKLDQMNKARDCLKKLESRITGRDRIPYHYLISLYGNLRDKEEVNRVWKIYKSNFPNIWNLGYHAMIASLVRLDDIEGAEKIYEEWVSARSSYDPRICNLLMGGYIRKGLIDKAEAFLETVIEIGGKVNANTWEILMEGYIVKKQIAGALSSLKEVESAERAESWRPKPANISAFLSLCDQESDLESKEVLLKVLKQLGCLENEAYMSMVNQSSTETNLGSKPSLNRDGVQRDDNDDDNESNLLLNQLQGSL